MAKIRVDWVVEPSAGFFYAEVDGFEELSEEEKRATLQDLLDDEHGPLDLVAVVDTWRDR